MKLNFGTKGNWGVGLPHLSSLTTGVSRTPKGTSRTPTQLIDIVFVQVGRFV